MTGARGAAAGPGAAELLGEGSRTLGEAIQWIRTARMNRLAPTSERLYLS